MTEHGDLQEALARTLRARRRNSIVFTEIALAGSFGSEGRLDVVVFTSTNRYRKIIIEGFEVKASRADLLSDLRSGKWRKYIDAGVLSRFSFAFPEGLAEADEIPQEAGVYVRGSRGGWRFARRPPDLGDDQPVTPRENTLARLIWRGSGRPLSRGPRRSRRRGSS